MCCLTTSKQFTAYLSDVRVYPGEPAKYETIFSGQVLDIEKIVWGLRVTGADITPHYHVYLSNIEIITGHHSGKNRIKIDSGCGVPIPKKGDHGVFFLGRGDKFRALTPRYFRAISQGSTDQHFASFVDKIELGLTAQQQS